jgi:CDP-diacylglycerol--glycerol-3-phosphate 3-phosphatidyltransferase
MNLPIFVTLLRIFLSVFVICPLTIVYGAGLKLIGFVFICAALTDFLDGFLARFLNKESSFGALLDPLADKILTISASVGLIFFYFNNNEIACGKIILISLYVIIIRDLLVTFIRHYAEKNGLTIMPSFAAKIKTCYLFFVLTMEYFGVFKKIGSVVLFGFKICFCNFFWVLAINLVIWSAIKYAVVLYRYISLFDSRD